MSVVGTVGQDSFTVGWKKATDYNPSATNLLYKMYIFEDGPYEVYNAQPKDSLFNISSYTFTGLKANTSYRVDVKVSDGNGNNASFPRLIVTTGGTKEYDIIVNNTKVTEDNANDVLGDNGSVKYDADANILTLTNAQFGSSATDVDLSLSVGFPITVNVVGDNKIDGRFVTNGMLSIEGTGSLTVTGRKPLVASGGLHLYGGCTVAAYSTIAASGVDVNNNPIMIVGSTLKAKSSADSLSIANCSGLTLEGSGFLSSHHYSDPLYNGDGNFYTNKNVRASDEVVITKGDINSDQRVNLTDLTKFIKLLNEGKTIHMVFDLNNDGVIDEKDVQTLSDILLGK